jgi:hypothetical protein
VSPFSAKKTRSKAYGKGLNADLKEFGDEEMAEFVEDDGRPKDEDKRYYRE